jgi:hypothetical protein
MRQIKTTKSLLVVGAFKQSVRIACLIQYIRHTPTIVGTFASVWTLTDGFESPMAKLSPSGAFYQLSPVRRKKKMPLRGIFKFGVWRCEFGVGVD